MNACKKNSIAAITALFMPLAVHAAQSHPCNQLVDDAHRLGCYDGAFGRPTPASTQSAVPATATAGVVTGAATTPAAPQSAPTPAPVQQAPPAKEELPETITSVIASLSHTPDGRFIATLENGQVWLQSERDSMADAKVGDKVTLRRMLFGNYSFVTRTGYTLRVKRVN
jgi:hypothetical protein